MAAGVLVGVALLTGIAVPSSAAAAQRAQCDGRAPSLDLNRSGKTFGTARADVIAGNRRANRISGRRGNDRICGRAGKDRLAGNAGNDRLFGGKGNDLLLGGPGADRLTGGPGRDRLFGNAGPDVIRAIDGKRDLVNCGPGKDRAFVDRIDRVVNCESIFPLPPLTGEAMPHFSLPAWSDAQWSDPSAYSTIQTGDIDGDGADELIGRGPLGVEAFDFDRSTGQWLPLYRQPSPALTDEDGWNQPAYYATIQLADVNGDGADELLARAADGLHAWQFNPATAAWEELDTLTELSDAEGWGSSPAYYETIQAGNVFGSKAEEVVARAADGMRVWSLTEVGWIKYTHRGPFADADGWTRPEYFKTINVDPGLIDNAGEYEVIWARAAGGIVFHRFTGSGWTRYERPMPQFSDRNNDWGDWSDPRAYSTIQAAINPTGDGASYIVGRSSKFFVGASVYRSLNRMIVDRAFSWDAGWKNPAYGSTIQAADIDGDGRDEFIGRSSSGVIALKTGTTGQCGNALCLIRSGQTATGFSDEGYWDRPRYYSTIQVVDAGEPGTSLLVGRGTSGIATSERGQAGAWRSPSAGFPAFSDGRQQAYLAISNALAGSGTDLRAAYPGWNPGMFSNARTTLAALGRPAEVPESDWSEVRSQIDSELQNGFLVADWYDNYLRPITQEIFTIQGMDETAAVIQLDTQKANELLVKQWSMVSGVVLGMARTAGALAPPAAAASALIGAAVSSGIGAPKINSGINGITARFIDLRNELQGDFQSAIRGLGESREEINGNYGLQLAVADRLIRAGLLSKMTASQTAVAEAGAAYAYSVHAWQTLAPAVWQAARFAGDRDSRNYYCTQLAACIYDVDGFAWTLSRGTDRGGFGGTITLALRNQLFGATSAECRHVWQFASCNLGVRPADVFNRRNGWESLPAYLCNAVWAGRWAERCESLR